MHYVDSLHSPSDAKQAISSEIRQIKEGTSDYHSLKRLEQWYVRVFTSLESLLNDEEQQTLLPRQQIQEQEVITLAQLIQEIIEIHLLITQQFVRICRKYKIDLGDVQGRKIVEKYLQWFEGIQDNFQSLKSTALTICIPLTATTDPFFIESINTIRSHQLKGQPKQYRPLFESMALFLPSYQHRLLKARHNFQQIITAAARHFQIEEHNTNHEQESQRIRQTYLTNAQYKTSRVILQEKASMQTGHRSVETKTFSKGSMMRRNRPNLKTTFLYDQSIDYEDIKDSIKTTSVSQSKRLVKASGSKNKIQGSSHQRYSLKQQLDQLENIKVALRPAKTKSKQLIHPQQKFQAHINGGDVMSSITNQKNLKVPSHELRYYQDVKLNSYEPISHIPSHRSNHQKKRVYSSASGYSKAPHIQTSTPKHYKAKLMDGSKQTDKERRDILQRVDRKYSILASKEKRYQLSKLGHSVHHRIKAMGKVRRDRKRGLWGGQVVAL